MYSVLFEMLRCILFFCVLFLFFFKQKTAYEIGIIAPVSHPFCGHCSRIRLTSDGKIRTCLFSLFDHDLAGRMHYGASDEELADYVESVVQKKEARHHIGEPDFMLPSRTMVHIGG